MLPSKTSAKIEVFNLVFYQQTNTIQEIEFHE